MAGFHETRVRQALMTVRDADVLCEMAAGWRTSIANLNAADDRIGRGIRALRDSDQFGDATRDAAIESFREMRDYIAEQRLRLGQTARALDAAGGALSQAAATVRRWDTMGDPVPPGPAPVADPAAADQAPYLAAVTAHGQQTAGHDQAVAQREDEARQLMETTERVFARSEDKIREQHGIPRDERPPVPPPTWPPVDWPGPRPEPVDPGWPPLPPWPPVVDHRDPTAPEPETEINPDPRPGHGPGAGAVPSATAGTSHAPSGPVHAASGSSGPTTSVAGSSQSGVALQGATSTGAPGSFGGASPASGSAGMAGLSGMAGSMGSAAAGAAAGRAGGAAAGRAGAGAGGAARAGTGRGAGTGTGSRAAGSGSGRSGPGGKGSQQASGSARSARATKPATSGQAGKSSATSGRSGTAGGRGGRRKDDKRKAPDVFTSGEHWLEGEDTSPDVLR